MAPLNGQGNVYRSDGSLVGEMRYEIETKPGRLQTVENFGNSVSTLDRGRGDQIEGRFPDMTVAQWRELLGQRLTLELEDGGILSFTLDASECGRIDSRKRTEFVEQHGSEV
jgi:hypothetical protein